MYPAERFSLQILNEGEEPNNFFWVGLNGKKAYDKEAPFMTDGRLFRYFIFNNHIKQCHSFQILNIL